jgi:hypothetical protein
MLKSKVWNGGGNSKRGSTGIYIIKEETRNERGERKWEKLHQRDLFPLYL